MRPKRGRRMGLGIGIGLLALIFSSGGEVSMMKSRAPQGAAGVGAAEAAQVGAAEAAGAGAAEAAFPAGRHVFVNQLGYLPQAAKRAVTDVETEGPYRVIDLATGMTVYEGAMSPPFDSRGFSGDTVWHADFSALTAPGRYVVHVDGVGTSHPFAISDEIYSELYYLTARSYFLQRCGGPVDDPRTGVAHEACHVQPSVVRHTNPVHEAGTPIDTAGGWHDAGDYGRYVAPAAVAASKLMLAYSLFPERFADGELDIPESGNGRPDLLDEVQVALEWMLKMQRSDGAVYRKVAGARWPRMVRPELDDQPLYVYGAAAPETAMFAAVMAQAARVYRHVDPAFSERALEAAKRAYDLVAQRGHFSEAQPGDDSGSGGYQGANTVDAMTWAAAELYLATGEDGYHSRFVERAAWHVFDDPGYWGGTSLGLFDYYWFAPDPDPAVKEHIRRAVRTRAQSLLSRSMLSGYGHTTRFDEFTWGSNRAEATHAMILLLAHMIEPDPAYEAAALRHLDYLLGVNPLSKSYVTGAGSDPVRHPHHRLVEATGTMVPGLLVGGPNNQLPDSPLANRGPRSYEDTMENYRVNEYAIDYNAPLVFAAAYFKVSQLGRPAAPLKPPSTQG